MGRRSSLELLTFYDFPKAIWKSIRTTNTLEHLNLPSFLTQEWQKVA